MCRRRNCTISDLDRTFLLTQRILDRFLPYNVQFEVDNKCAGDLGETKANNDIFEIVPPAGSNIPGTNPAMTSQSRTSSMCDISSLSVNSSARNSTNNIHTSLVSSSAAASKANAKQLYQTDEDISIIDSLTNIHHDSGIFNEDAITTPLVRQEDDGDLSSISSGELGPTDSHRVHPLHSEHVNASQPNAATKSHNLSVQDFFFNNPYKSKHKSVESLEDIDNSNNSHQSTFYDHKNSSVSSLNSNLTSVNPNSSSSMVIKPKAIIRNPIVASINSAKKLIAEEPQMSSLRIAMRRDVQGHGLTLNKVDVQSKEETPTPLESPCVELDEFDSLKVAPFGGFSKPQKELLKSETNIFGNASWSIVESGKGNGSLTKAVETARDRNMFENEKVQWVGTVSTPNDLIPVETKNLIGTELNEKYHCDALFIDDEEFNGYYHSFCKTILWPIFHYKIPNDPKSNAFENDSWNYYESVNKKFAERIANQLKDGDTVWIHDYHLMLVPKFLRQLKPNAKIGFFLHISFPSSEIFRCLAQRNKILEGLLGADCINFQTEEYLGHFLQSCNRLLLADFDDKNVYYDGNTTNFTYNPIGINFQNLDKVIKSPTVFDWRKLIRERWKDKQLIVSRDKLDEIRGIKEKLLAYERFLNDNPDFIEKTIMILICLSNNNNNGTSTRYENEIFQIVERINSKASGISEDQPVVLLHQDIGFDQYLALLSEANLFIVSTLREGMNLTCHEFICATYEMKSPLILSEFVGSADVLTRGPLLINPYNVKHVSETILQGLTMPFEEKDKRWHETINTILKHDSQNWVRNCLESLNEAYIYKKEHEASSLKPFNATDFKSMINVEGNRLFILNLDTLVTNLVIEGKVIHSIQQQLVNTTLNNLTANKRNFVYVTSYKQRSELSRMYKRVGDLGFISENGAFVKPPHKYKWIKMNSSSTYGQKWMTPVRTILESFCERIPGSYIEQNECSINFHISNTKDIEQDHLNSLVGDLITHVNELYTKDFNIHARLFTDGIVNIQEKNIIGRSLQCVLDDSKPMSSSDSLNTEIPISPTLSSASSFSTSWIEEGSFDFVMACGGSGQIDEEVYDIVNDLPDNVVTVRVGKYESGTSATRALKGINELLNILKESA